VGIAKVRLLGSFGGQIWIEWTLTIPVDDWWIAAFDRSPAQKRGSVAFVVGGTGDPVVCPEGTIRWNVPHADLTNAVAFVLQSVTFANAALKEKWVRHAS
jgi:hypothetical protein